MPASIDDAPSILFINRVYPPVSGATGQLLKELVTDLADNGWRVSVISGSCPGEPGITKVSERINVYRLHGLPQKGHSFFWRAISHLSLYPLLLFKAMRLPRHDVVVSLTDPPLQLILTVLLKRIKQTRAVHWAQDLYPEVAESLGVISECGALSNLLRAISTKALQYHDQIITVGRCMQQRMIERGIRVSETTVIPNWALEGSSAQSINSDTFRRMHNLVDRFVIMYSGNMGLAHIFQPILDAAEILQRTLPEALILFVGDGPRKDWILAQVEERSLENILMLPYQPLASIGVSLRAADLHLVTMRSDLLGLVVPSKVYGVLAAGKPCLFIGPKECEVARFIEEQSCGEVLNSDSGEDLAERIHAWYLNKVSRIETGRRGQRAAREARINSFELFRRVLGKEVEPVSDCS